MFSDILRKYVFINIGYSTIAVKLEFQYRDCFMIYLNFLRQNFGESVKYYQGNISPIDACKKENGWSSAWMHHKGINKHHYEYWQDNFDNGGTPIEMPIKYKKEMLCDYLGAGRAYYGKDFTYMKEYDWWQNKMKKPLAMHPNDKAFITMWLSKLVNEGNVIFRKLRETEK